jgi:hypothetical protein
MDNERQNINIQDFFHQDDPEIDDYPIVALTQYFDLLVRDISNLEKSKLDDRLTPLRIKDIERIYLKIKSIRALLSICLNTNEVNKEPKSPKMVFQNQTSKFNQIVQESDLCLTSTQKSICNEQVKEDLRVIDLIMTNLRKICRDFFYRCLKTMTKEELEAKFQIHAEDTGDFYLSLFDVFENDPLSFVPPEDKMKLTKDLIRSAQDYIITQNQEIFLKDPKDLFKKNLGELVRFFYFMEKIAEIFPFVIIPACAIYFKAVITSSLVVQEKIKSNKYNPDYVNKIKQNPYFKYAQHWYGTILNSISKDGIIDRNSFNEMLKDFNDQEKSYIYSFFVGLVKDLAFLFEFNIAEEIFELLKEREKQEPENFKNNALDSIPLRIENCRKDFFDSSWELPEEKNDGNGDQNDIAIYKDLIFLDHLYDDYLDEKELLEGGEHKDELMPELKQKFINKIISYSDTEPHKIKVDFLNCNEINVAEEERYCNFLEKAVGFFPDSIYLLYELYKTYSNDVFSKLKLGNIISQNQKEIFSKSRFYEKMLKLRQDFESEISINGKYNLDLMTNFFEKITDNKEQFIFLIFRINQDLVDSGDIQGAKVKFKVFKIFFNSSEFKNNEEMKNAIDDLENILWNKAVFRVGRIKGNRKDKKKRKK